LDLISSRRWNKFGAIEVAYMKFNELRAGACGWIIMTLSTGSCVIYGPEAVCNLFLRGE
jgi:hypothetical protein